MCCKSHHHKSCSCQCEKSHGCEKHAHFSRRFLSKQEKISQLEGYLADLQAEALAVEERIAELQSS
jgi:hypothetical protein